jgi:sugar phosphate isomerase/epimerase
VPDDNRGVRRRDIDAPGIDPLKLDLHLPPGRGSLPSGRIAGALRDHDAPLLLEVEPSRAPRCQSSPPDSCARWPRRRPSARRPRPRRPGAAAARPRPGPARRRGRRAPGAR